MKVTLDGFRDLDLHEGCKILVTGKLRINQHIGVVTLRLHALSVELIARSPKRKQSPVDLPELQPT